MLPVLRSGSRALGRRAGGIRGLGSRVALELTVAENTVCAAASWEHGCPDSCYPKSARGGPEQSSYAIGYRGSQKTEDHGQAILTGQRTVRRSNSVDMEEGGVKLRN